MAVPILAIVFAVMGLSRVCGGTPTQDVRQIGLAALYQALFAVANCRNVGLDEPAFRRAVHLYRLAPVDMTIGGPFSANIADLAETYRIRFEDDPGAFCSVARLSYAVPHGILVDRGPVIPHPLPFRLPGTD